MSHLCAVERISPPTRKELNYQSAFEECTQILERDFEQEQSARQVTRPNTTDAPLCTDRKAAENNEVYRVREGHGQDLGIFVCQMITFRLDTFFTRTRKNERKVDVFSAKTDESHLVLPRKHNKGNFVPKTPLKHCIRMPKFHKTPRHCSLQDRKSVYDSSGHACHRARFLLLSFAFKKALK